MHWQSLYAMLSSPLLQKNHLSGLQQTLLKVIFWNSQHLMEIRREMQPVIRRNKNKANINDAYKAFGPQRNNNSIKLQVGSWVGRCVVGGADNASTLVLRLVECFCPHVFLLQPCYKVLIQTIRKHTLFWHLKSIQLKLHHC